jgi:hypothetical protein
MARNKDRPQSAGLKSRKRGDGTIAWYWLPSVEAVKAGYDVKSVNLTMYADRPEMLKAKAERCQAEMNLWLRQGKMPEKQFNDTFRDLFERYQSHPKSSFHEIKPHVRRSYLVYLRKMIRHIGPLRVSTSNGLDVKDWFAEWRVGVDGRDQLAAANMALSVLKAAVSFGVICRLDGVKEFQAVLAELEFPKPKPRKHAPTAEQIIAARLAAHKHVAPERALVYALQFETTARQWDFTGTWLPMSDPKPSAVIDGGNKWVGPHWSDIKDGVLTIRPTKTEDSTAVAITYDLSACEMVVEELVHHVGREGPMIVNHATGLPYRPAAFNEGWRKDYEAAGIPKEIWNRDTRAGGITEGRLSGASQDDRRRLAGHADADQTGEYERGIVDLQAHRNVMAARRQFRAKNGS